MYAFSSPGFWLRFFREFRCPYCGSLDGYVSRPRTRFERYGLSFLLLPGALRRLLPAFVFSEKSASQTAPQGSPFRSGAEARVYAGRARQGIARVRYLATEAPISGLREAKAAAILIGIRLVGALMYPPDGGRSSSAVLGTELGLRRPIL